MKTVANQNVTPLASETSAAHISQPFPPLDQETRTHVGTDQAAFYCMRAPQTMRMWQALQPKGAIRATKVNGRLAWKISDIKALLNGGV